MKIYVAHSRQFDFKNDLYRPLQQSSLTKSHQFIFPHQNDTFINSKPIIKNCDLVIAEISYPSIGEGVELGWANDAGVKIICAYHKGSPKPSSLSLLTDTFVIYQQPDDLINQLETLL